MMLLAPGRFNTSPSAIWDSANKGAHVALTNGDTTATKNTSNAYHNVFSTTSKSTGKWYFEVSCVAMAGGTAFAIVGLAPVGHATSGASVGSGADGYGYYAGGNKYNNATLTAFGSSYAGGVNIGVAVDIDAGKIWFARNNTWQASGSPSTGANEAFSGIPAGSYKGGCSLYQTAGTADQFDSRFNGAQQVYLPPAGFIPWGSP